MFHSLGYSKRLLENFSITDNLLISSTSCSEPTCQIQCFDCFTGCYTGPNPGPKPKEPS
jgi:hypothetical protein